MLLNDERRQLVDYGKRMQADNLTVGTSGNISIRSGDLIAITPSGAAYDELTPESISVIDLSGRHVDGQLEPSSEVPMHTKVYQHTDAVAVVHTHPLYASALSTLLDEIPPVHYMIALLGGPVRVAPYATFGSPELAENSVHAMKDRYGVVLANHGATTYGESLRKAYSRSIYLEWVCQMYYQARLLGRPRLLPEDEIDRVGGKLTTYGQTVEPSTT
ncbi:class II aldolase/adducin family protein [Haloechinothrix sp. YIM 98757]|uniref:Class II aldolase/adducin family protein n=1 Tax=Haloechinothrix aidingensis TaxID=2752311 RepID=A0A838AAV0_9PSEU|nr:class II aldolase/adducin family protein [Haloechinothrix aidingensis]MBA0126371.1 class II aldolase/adducin family protein [Haloechinothrix aidingensis]